MPAMLTSTLRFALAGAVLTLGRPVAAELAPGAEETVPSMHVHMVGALAQDAELRSVIGEWLSSSRIAHTVTTQPSLSLGDIRAPGGHGPPVRLWLVRRDAAHVRLYLAEPAEQRYLVRELELSTQGDELQREELSQVVLSLALDFVARRASSSLAEIADTLADRSTEPRVVTARAKDTRTPAAPPMTRPNRLEQGPWFGFGAGATYGLRSGGKEGIAHGPGVVVAGDWSRPNVGLWMSLRGQYFLPHEASTHRIAVDLRELQGLGELGPYFLIQRHTRAGVALGFGGSFVHVAPRHAPGTELLPRDPRWDQRPFVSGALRLEHQRRWWWMGLSFRVEIPLLDTHYDVASPTGTRRELSPLPVQPGLFFELGWASRASTDGRKGAS